MNEHDPLCRYAPSEYVPERGLSREWAGAWTYPVPCHCDLIAKARADEREKAAKRIWTLKPDRVYTSGGVAYTDALKDAIEAVHGRADILRGES